MKIKRFFGVLLAAAFVLCAFAVTASAEVKDTTKDVTLTIYALESEDGSDVKVDASVTGEQITLPDKKPIESVGFALYKVADGETSTETPEGEPDFTSALTGEDGKVTIVIPASAQGRYLVVENEKPNWAVGTTVPFLVDLPMTSPSGDSFMYDVFAYPKQETVDKDLPDDTDIEPEDSDDEDSKNVPDPDIHKWVSDDAKTWGSLANIASIEGKKAYWKVTVSVPKNANRFKVFTVGDVIESRLTAPSASEVKVSSAGKELPSAAYTVTVTGQTIKVDFATKELRSYYEKDIDIIYPTFIKLDADKAVGYLIPNTAVLTYTNLKPGTEPDNPDGTKPDNPDGTRPDSPDELTKESETPNVYTGEIEGFKHDADKKALSGAEFTLYSDKACKNKIASSASDNSGKFGFKGLKDGTYYLKETKAPEGYQKNDNVIEVKVQMKDNKAVAAVDVQNIKESSLPVTGGAGIIGISAAGIAIALLGGAFIALALKERKKALNAIA